MKGVKCAKLKSPEIWKNLQASANSNGGKARETKFPQYNKMKVEKFFDFEFEKNKKNKFCVLILKI